VPYDSEIWVRFTVPLDSTALSDHSVFLKADTRRLPIAVTWQAATRTLRIVSLERLGLRKTYTVELPPALRFADGTTLGQSFISQFTTNSLRRVQSPLPMHQQAEQSPFVALRWGGQTEASAGTVTYEVHASSDSTRVFDPATALGTRSAPLYLPKARWSQDTPTYWGIVAVNATTGERFQGPVWRFSTLPASTPYDSILATYSDFDWVTQARPTFQTCSGNEVRMGPDILCTYRWNLGSPDTTVRLAGAYIEMTPMTGVPAPDANGPSVWLVTASFAPCDARWPGPPLTDEVDGRLAIAVQSSPTRHRFSGDALVAHLEATRRFGGLYGYLFRSTVTRRYWAAFTAPPNPVLWLYVYRRAP
jgi:hypothetical protein